MANIIITEGDVYKAENELYGIFVLIVIKSLIKSERYT